jgi:hypothetical protein
LRILNLEALVARAKAEGEAKGGKM